MSTVYIWSTFSKVFDISRHFLKFSTFSKVFDIGQHCRERSIFPDICRHLLSPFAGGPICINQYSMCIVGMPLFEGWLEPPIYSIDGNVPQQIGGPTNCWLMSTNFENVNQSWHLSTVDVSICWGAYGVGYKVHNLHLVVPYLRLVVPSNVSTRNFPIFQFENKSNYYHNIIHMD